MSEFVTVCKRSEVAGSTRKVVEAGGIQIVLAEVEGELIAFLNGCPHVGCVMDDGEIAGGEVVCSAHGSCFNLKTGDVVNGPAREALPVYEVKVDGDDVQVGI